MTEETPPLGSEDEPTRVGTLDEAVPERIGPYRLLQRLGEGGMGVVWEAEQSEPVHRRVALKLIKPGMDSKVISNAIALESTS